jgi:predicted TIM-barrel fold metal-dependent hydrolase
VDTGSIDSVDTVIKMINHNEVRGLKYHGNGIGQPIMSLESSGMIAIAQSHDIPIIIHTDFSEPVEGYSIEYANPMDVLKLAKRYPKARLSTAHSGLFSRKFLEGLKERSNVWIDCAPITTLCGDPKFKVKDRVEADYSCPRKVIEHVYELFPDRLLWGSDTPYHDNSTYENEVSILNSLDKQIQESISCQNIERFLGN